MSLFTRRAFLRGREAQEVRSIQKWGGQHGTPHNFSPITFSPGRQTKIFHRKMTTNHLKSYQRFIVLGSNPTHDVMYKVLRGHLLEGVQMHRTYVIGLAHPSLAPNL